MTVLVAPEQEHAKEITKMRQEFDLNAKELQQKSDRKVMKLQSALIENWVSCTSPFYIQDSKFVFKWIMFSRRYKSGKSGPLNMHGDQTCTILVQIKNLRDECDLRRKQEIHEIEERKNVHVNELMKKHEKAFTEIKCYYNDITHNNLDLIKTLKVGMPIFAMYTSKCSSFCV